MFDDIINSGVEQPEEESFEAPLYDEGVSGNVAAPDYQQMLMQQQQVINGLQQQIQGLTYNQYATQQQQMLTQPKAGYGDLPDLEIDEDTDVKTAVAKALEAKEAKEMQLRAEAQMAYNNVAHGFTTEFPEFAKNPQMIQYYKGVLEQTLMKINPSGKFTARDVQQAYSVVKDPVIKRDYEQYLQYMQQQGGQMKRGLPGGSNTNYKAGSTKQTKNTPPPMRTKEDKYKDHEAYLKNRQEESLRKKLKGKLQ